MLVRLTMSIDSSNFKSENSVTTGSPEQAYSNEELSSEPDTDEVDNGSSIESPSTNMLLPNPYIVYQFELPASLCGRLIGRFGHCVREIKLNTNANIIVNNHPYANDAKVCSVEGNNQLLILMYFADAEFFLYLFIFLGYRDEIRNALQMIRSRFPTREFPEVTLQQINAINPLDKINCAIPLPRSCQVCNAIYDII